MEKNTGNSQASTQIQEVLQKMRLTYIEKLPRQLDEMEALILQLNKGEDFPGSYETLYRAIHSLKGTAGTYGVRIISTICHPFEDYLKASLEGGPGASDQQISTCLDFTGLLRKALELVAAGRESFPEIEAYLESI